MTKITEVRKFVEQARREAVEAERALWEDRISSALAVVYRDNYVLVAELCDEHLDQSGALLGVVRRKASDIAKAIEERE